MAPGKVKLSGLDMDIQHECHMGRADSVVYTYIYIQDYTLISSCSKRPLLTIIRIFNPKFPMMCLRYYILLSSCLKTPWKQNVCLYVYFNSLFSKLSTLVLLQNVVRSPVITSSRSVLTVSICKSHHLLFHWHYQLDNNVI